MSFSVVYGCGALECLEPEVESVALQFPDSMHAVYASDLLLLTEIHPQVLYALGSEFTVSETQFGGAVATKWTITNWTQQRPHMCRFDMNHKVTVTFGFYPTLYSLENDMAILSAKPRHKQHFVCLVIPRSLNWQAMVYMCCSVLQVQCPYHHPSRAQDDVLILGWQRGSAVSYSAPLRFHDFLPLLSPVPGSSPCSLITQFNSQPVYILTYIMASGASTPHYKRRRLCVVTPETSLHETEPVVTECKIDISEEVQDSEVERWLTTLPPPPQTLERTASERTASERRPPTPTVPKHKEEEDWVLTVLYDEEFTKE